MRRQKNGEGAAHFREFPAKGSRSPAYRYFAQRFVDSCSAATPSGSPYGGGNRGGANHFSLTLTFCGHKKLAISNRNAEAAQSFILPLNRQFLIGVVVRSRYSSYEKLSSELSGLLC